MKKNKFLLWAMALATGLVMTACSSDDEETGGGNTPAPVPEQPKYGEMKAAQLAGFVYDVNGAPLSGVQVTSGTTVTTTDLSGSFSLTNINVVDGRTVVSLKKDGYFDVVRSFSTADKDNWAVVMVAKQNSPAATSASYQASQSQTLKTTAGMQVDMPAGGYKNAETGAAYNGQVKTEMVYLDPDADNFAQMMPGGDLAAVRTDNTPIQLVSYGMTQVSMTDNSGNKLQLADGKKAKLTFPVPESLKNDLHPEIPLWSFNENTGLWEEEGVAKLENGVYVGEVSHFSWVNLDWPEIRSTIKGTVKDESGRLLPQICIHIGQTIAYTNSQGVYQTYVPANTEFDVWVASEDYANYAATDADVVSVHVSGIAAQQTHTANLTLPTLTYISGKVVNENGNNLATVWITFNGKDTRAVHTDFDGNFNIMTPAGYTGPATLKIRTTNGELFTKQFTITGGNQSLGEVKVNTTPTPDPDPAGGGIVYVTVNSTGETFQLVLKNNVSGSLTNGLFQIDSLLTAFNMEDEQTETSFSHNYWFIEIQNYASDKTNFTGSFSYMEEGGNEQGQKWIGAQIEEANFVVKRNGKQFVFDMNGAGGFRYQVGEHTIDWDWQKPNAEFLGSNMAFDPLMIGHTETNIMNSSSLPSFTPYLSKAYPAGIIITESTLFSRGGILYADGTKADYQQLLTAAKNLGWQRIEGSDAEDTDVEGEAAFYDGKNSYIAIDFSAYNRFEYNGGSAYNMSAPIEVNVIEGLTVDPTQFNQDEKYRSRMLGSFKKVKALRK